MQAELNSPDYTSLCCHQTSDKHLLKKFGELRSILQRDVRVQIICREEISPLALELDIYSLAHQLYKM